MNFEQGNGDKRNNESGSCDNKSFPGIDETTIKSGLPLYIRTTSKEK